jgi:uncharacterized membrane protein
MGSYVKLLSFFFIYAFLGWCSEVVYATIQEKKFVNRGFLNGPICPIYGFGVLIVLLLLRPLDHNLILLFAGSVLLTSVLEFVTGFVLEKVFCDKWWDYSQHRFQLMGYVCLEFSLMWGAACVLVVRVIHPLFDRFVSWFPPVLGRVLLFVYLAVFLADAVITVASMLKLKRNLRLLREISHDLGILSEELGEKLSEGVLTRWNWRRRRRNISKRRRRSTTSSKAVTSTCSNRAACCTGVCSLPSPACSAASTAKRRNGCICTGRRERKSEKTREHDPCFYPEIKTGRQYAVPFALIFCLAACPVSTSRR